MLLVALVTVGLGAWTPAAQAADTGNPAPLTGKIVSDEPGTNAPNILDGTTYSIAKVGNTIIVGGQFTQAENYNTSTVVTRRDVLAFDATTGKLSTTFAPDALGTVYKVLPAGDGQSVYVAGGFQSAGGQSMPGRIFKINVTTGAIDPNFVAPQITGDIRDLELVGNHLFIAGKFTNINGVAQKGLGTLYADTGKRDPYFNSVLSGLHNPGLAGSVTDVLQISVNPADNELMAVGNFTTVDGQARSQIARFDIGNVPTGVDTTVHQTLSTWSTNLYTASCSAKFDTYMTDVEYSRDGSYFVVSTTGAYGGSDSNNGTVGCDLVARFEDNTTATSKATWTAYTGGDTTWTVEVTDNVIYTGGHMRWQNNPTAGDKAGQGAVSREGIAALNPLNGMPYSWDPTRARGVGIQDLLATSDGLYVGSDTTLIGHTAGNTYHARIAFLPLAGGKTLPQQQTNTLPVDVYKVATGATALQKRSFTGTTAGTATNVPTGPGWGTSVGAFMVNGLLYKLNTDGTVSKMTFDGTNYGTAVPVATADAIVPQTDWHTDVKTITSIFYSAGRIYFTKSGSNALWRRGFEVEDDVVGQQRFSTTTPSLNWTTVRGAFVAGGKLYYANTAGNLFSATWDQANHNIVAGTVTSIASAGTGWASRAIFPYQDVPAPVNEPPVASATISCTLLHCSFDGSASTDPENGSLSYAWDFGDGTFGTGQTTTHDYSSAGDRSVTLTVTDNKGATNSVVKTASATDHADTITFDGSNNNNGSRSSHTIAIPATAKVGDTVLLFFTANSTSPVYTAPAGWTQVLNQSGSSSIGQVYSHTVAAGEPGTNVTITSKSATDGTAATVKSDLTIAAYGGLGTPAINASAMTTQTVATAVHQTPTVNAADGTSWLVSYWSDKSTTANGTATNWTGPAGQTQRSEGTASGTSHVSSLLTDSNNRVNSGVEGGLNATSDTSATGLTASILLTGGSPAPANQPPVAHAANTGCTNLTCTFDGGLSSDPEGGTLTYDWNFGDGSADVTTVSPTHTFPGAGPYTVTLTVADPKNAKGSDTVSSGTLTVPPANAAPTAAITSTTCTNLTCSPDGSTSSDPDHDTLTYDWNWGDSSPHDTTANPTHTYAAPGADHTVTLTVDDGHGHTSQAQATLTTTNPPNTAPTAHITAVSCSGMTCSFSGLTSSDPDHDTLTYSWDFGDGQTSTVATPSVTYTDTAQKTVTLTVDDGNSHQSTDTTQVTPTTAPVSNVTFIGAASNAGNSTSRTVTLPTGVQTGDTMLLFLGSASITPTYNDPAGWTVLETKNGTSAMAVRAYTKQVTQADLTAGKVVTTMSSAAKADLSLAVYRGTGGSPVDVSASKIDNAAGPAHTSPSVTATGDTDWLVTYWADRSNSTTAFTAPSGVTVRKAGLPSDTGNAHAIGLLADSNGPVASGPEGQLTATANGDSSRGASVSILLTSN